MKIAWEIIQGLFMLAVICVLGTALFLSIHHTMHEAPIMKQQIRHLESRVLELEDVYDKGNDNEPS